MKKITCFLVAISFAIVSCNSPKEESTSVNGQNDNIEQEGSNKGQAFIDDSSPTILNLAIGSKDHSTLVAAVQAAKLENALVNTGPLTVFAPTNAAFEALPKGTVENLLKPENIAALKNILEYHVTPGKLTKAYVKKFKELGQANNGYVKVTFEGDDVFVGGAKIIASIPASNGIIHVIDKVLLPPPTDEKK